MMVNRVLNVELDLEGQHFSLGRLALDKSNRYCFEYNNDFLRTGFEISPFHLALQAKLQFSQSPVFDGLFGVFYDSLPDAWGSLLLDRKLRELGINPRELTLLDRLSYVGKRGAGALIYEPDTELAFTSILEQINLDHLAKLSAEVLDSQKSSDVTALLQLSESMGGARPKVAIGLSADKKTFIHESLNLTKDFEHWLVKFPAKQDLQDIGAIEYAYSLMAKRAGIEMAATHLFSAECNAGYFATQRFDRNSDGHRLHLHSASGLLQADYNYPSLDYESLLRLTLSLTRNMQELEKVFRLTCFNVFAHNRDDHSKNFAFLMNAKGEWKFAPAYDLTFSYGPGAEHSMLVAGNGRDPGEKELLKLAGKFDLTNARDIIIQVRDAVAAWDSIAGDLDIAKESRKMIAQKINS